MLVKFKSLYYLFGEKGGMAQKKTASDKEGVQHIELQDEDQEEEEEEEEEDYISEEEEEKEEEWDDEEDDDDEKCNGLEEIISEEEKVQKIKETTKEKDEVRVQLTAIVANQKIKKDDPAIVETKKTEVSLPKQKQLPQLPKPPTNIFATSVQNIFTKIQNPPQRVNQPQPPRQNIFETHRKSLQDPVTMQPQRMTASSNLFSNTKVVHYQIVQPQKSSMNDNTLKEIFHKSLCLLSQFIVEPEEEKNKATSNYGNYRSNYKGNEPKKEKLYTFSISPSLAELKTYNLEKLSKISDFKIWNKYGEIIFTEDISIKDVNLEEIIIIPNKIEVLSDSLRGKQRQLVFHNYMGYANACPSDKKFLKKQILSEMRLKFYKIVYHSEYDGDLVVV